MKMDVQFEEARWKSCVGAVARQLNQTVEEVLPYAVASIVKWAMNKEPAPNATKQQKNAIGRARDAAGVNMAYVKTQKKGITVTSRGLVQFHVTHGRTGKRYKPLYSSGGFTPNGPIQGVNAKGKPYSMEFSPSTKSFIIEKIAAYEQELKYALKSEELAQFFPRLAWAQILMDLHGIGAINVDNVIPKRWNGGKASILRAVARDGRPYKNASGRKFGGMESNNLAIEIEQAFPNAGARKMEDRFVYGFRTQAKEIEKQFRDEIFKDQSAVAKKYPGLIVTR